MSYLHATTFLLATLLCACSGEKAERTTSQTVSKAVELAKGVATGVNHGVEDGRKASPSMDGARVINTGAELTAALQVEVLKVQPVKPDPDTPAESGQPAASEVVMAFANTADTPVRVVDLASAHRVVALDKAGFACTPHRIDDEFTVPPKSKHKVAFQFECDEAVAVLRMFDQEYPTTALK